MLSLAGLALLASLRMDESGLAFDDSPDAFDDAGLNDDASLFTLDTWLDGVDDASDTGEDDPSDRRLEASLGGDDPLGCDNGLPRLDDASDDRSPEDCEPLESLTDETDRLASEDFDGEPLLCDSGDREEDRTDRSDDEGQLESELRRLLLGLLCDKLSSELLSDDSINELGEDRADSLTLEKDLLDP